MSGRSSAAAHRSATSTSLSAAATGNESPSLLSTQFLTAPPATAAAAVSRTDTRRNSLVPLSKRYLAGPSPDSSSSSSTPKAYTSASRDGSLESGAA
uniref:Uncharacterized protein n=1 Tax=Arundo donax TaxID=35708 RepID=A0A0A9FQ08_ARUDO